MVTMVMATCWYQTFGMSDAIIMTTTSMRITQHIAMYIFFCGNGRKMRQKTCKDNEKKNAQNGTIIYRLYQNISGMSDVRLVANLAKNYQRDCGKGNGVNVMHYGKVKKQNIFSFKVGQQIMNRVTKNYGIGEMKY